jgi:hypothetical protein
VAFGGFCRAAQLVGGGEVGEHVVVHDCGVLVVGPYANGGVPGDSAALAGIALGPSCAVLHITTGSALWDGAASLLTGLLPIAVAVVLMRRTLALLIDGLLAVPAIAAVEITPVERTVTRWGIVVTVASPVSAA